MKKLSGGSHQPPQTVALVDRRTRDVRQGRDNFFGWQKSEVSISVNSCSTLASAGGMTEDHGMECFNEGTANHHQQPPSSHPLPLSVGVNNFLLPPPVKDRKPW